MMPPRHFFPLDEAFLQGIPNKILDIQYCTDSPLQMLDLYYPNEKHGEPLPLIIHTHGGAFANGDRRDTQSLPMLGGLSRGFAVASIQYRRSREAIFPAQLYDAKAAVRYLRANAQTLGLDPNRFAAWGASSGGWLASMLGVTAGNPAFEDLAQGNAQTSSAVQAVIDWCGPCGDFIRMDEAFKASYMGNPDHGEPDSPESRFLGHTLSEVPELSRLACPCTYVHADMPPVFILHGTADQIVPVEQSIAFCEAIGAKAGAEKVKMHLVEGKLHHGDPWYNEPLVTEECLDFLQGVLA